MGRAGFVYVFKNISIGTTAIKEKEGMNLTVNEGDAQEAMEEENGRRKIM